MASHQPAKAVSLGVGGYKRVSRKGAPRRFACEHPGCGKVYSRAEHLQRHQLNHNPREIFQCDVGDCSHRFVRIDLLARHKKRHTAAYTPRSRIASSARPQRNTPAPAPFAGPPAGPHDAAILLSPESNEAATPAPLPSQLPSMAGPSMAGHGHGAPWTSPHQRDMLAAAAFANAGYPAADQLAQGDFAAWLFDPQTTYNDLSVASLPFLEGGLESRLNNDIHYDGESLNSLSPREQAMRHSDAPDDCITEARRQDLLYWFQTFRKKQPRYEPLMPNFVHDSGGDLPAFNPDMVRDCLGEFWDNVSPRLPIVHQHTFSVNRCPVFLLLVMMSLGAASLRSRDTTGRLSEYGAFADVVISSVRWEILTSDDSAPPISLWVAQALLLLEFYEKLYSSRRLHERAHIYHAAFLTLLRRGSPLIGSAGSETPPEPEASGPDGATAPGLALDSQTWWAQWAETESMQRVVFGAFMLDIVHAAMFGHAADMAAHEIRLPLPCDDNLWKASSPDVVRQLDANLRMYGVRQVSFLDGLKKALHGKEVKTHAFGRMIIISGLLSVGWHLSHKETHLKWLDLRTASTETQDNWKEVLFRAFGKWKESFDAAMSDLMTDDDAPSHRPVPNGPINSASLLFHLAHISLGVDIIDCQVYAGARRLLGRRVSSRDYANAVKRMSSWAQQASTRHAILHAFKLLCRVLVERQPARRRSNAHAADLPTAQYSLRNETDPHRPWTLYYAVLAIWAFVQAVGRAAGKGFPLRPSQAGHSTYSRMAEYLSAVAALPELDEAAAAALHEGLPELLDVMEGILGEADMELLVEARERLGVCRAMLLGGSR